MHSCYIAVIVAALAVLFFGAWNPPCFQTKVNGVPSGHASYMWLAVLGLVAGAISCHVLKMDSVREAMAEIGSYETY